MHGERIKTVSETFIILKSLARQSCKVPVILVTLQGNICSRQLIEKILKYHVSQISVKWERSCSMRTGTHDEANSRYFSRFGESA